VLLTRHPLDLYIRLITTSSIRIEVVGVSPFDAINVTNKEISKDYILLWSFVHNRQRYFNWANSYRSITFIYKRSLRICVHAWRHCEQTGMLGPESMMVSGIVSSLTLQAILILSHGLNMSSQTLHATTQRIFFSGSPVFLDLCLGPIHVRWGFHIERRQPLCKFLIIYPFDLFLWLSDLFPFHFWLNIVNHIYTESYKRDGVKSEEYF
jgi:hypothetical protein